MLETNAVSVQRCLQSELKYGTVSGNGKKKNARQKLLLPRFGFLQHLDEAILNVYVVVVGLLHHLPLSLLQKCSFAQHSIYGFCSQNLRL